MLNGHITKFHFSLRSYKMADQARQSLRKKGLEYLKSKALTDKNKAELSLSLLLDLSVGIGDHSTEDFYNNLDEALNTLVDAEDRLEILKKNFNA